MRRSLGLLSIVSALAISACGDDGDSASKTSAQTGTQTTAPETATGCKRVAVPKPKGPQHLRRPRAKLNPKRTNVISLVTNCGTIEITLAVRRAPKTTASVASLVRRGFYDNLTFHRIAHGADGGDFVIQGGDPLGNGQGGPGYSVVEAPPRGLRYERGVVAMAKTEVEAPGTSGSQFYIVTAEDSGLPPDYALLGRVTKGDDVVSRIAASDTGPPPGEAPAQPIVIERATLKVS